MESENAIAQVGNRAATIQAKLYAVSVDVATCAVLVVDMRNDFGIEGGMDYSCVLLEDCTGEPIGHDFQRSNHDASLLTIQVLLGWTSSSVEFIHALELRDLAHAGTRVPN